MFVVAEKERVLRCSLQLDLEMRLYTPWTEEKTDAFSKYVMKRIMRKKRKWIKSARKKKNAWKKWRRTCA